jgi:hypothetical protein
VCARSSSLGSLITLRFPIEEASDFIHRSAKIAAIANTQSAMIKLTDETRANGLVNT